MRSMDDLPADERRYAVNDRVAVWVSAVLFTLAGAAWLPADLYLGHGLADALVKALGLPVTCTGTVVLVFRWAYERWPW